LYKLNEEMTNEIQKFRLNSFQPDAKMRRIKTCVDMLVEVDMYDKGEA